ncbi:aminoglycoside 6-adenylyltransferase [Bacillus sp. FJAT-29814]
MKEFSIISYNNRIGCETYLRTENEMFDLIVGTAENDERIRTVLMGG